MSNGPFSQRIPKSFLRNDTVIIIALNRVIQAKLSPPTPSIHFCCQCPIVRVKRQLFHHVLSIKIIANENGAF